MKRRLTSLFLVCLFALQALGGSGGVLVYCLHEHWEGHFLDDSREHCGHSAEAELEGSALNPAPHCTDFTLEGEEQAIWRTEEAKLPLPHLAVLERLCDFAEVPPQAPLYRVASIRGPPPAMPTRIAFVRTVKLTL